MSQPNTGGSRSRATELTGGSRLSRPCWVGALLLIAASLLLVVLVWALFGQAGNFQYLLLDDPNYTFNCPFVKDGLSWTNVCEAFRRLAYEGIWMPVTDISYMCTISLFGPGAGAHHLVSVAIHALNAVLLLWLLFFVTADVGGGGTRSCASENYGRAGARPSRGFAYFATAFLLSAFWALHPQRAEAVAWIASRKELLCTTFVLGGLLCWFRARRREGWGWIPALAGVYACFVLACMSKPTAMCFPFLVLAVEGMIAGGRDKRDPPVSSVAQERDPPAGGSGVLPIHVPSRAFYILNFSLFLLIAAATGALAVYSQTHAEGYAERALYSAPLWWRILNALVAVGLYIFQMVIPVGIHLDYRAVPGNWPLQGTLGLAVLALVAALAGAGAWWWLRRRARRRTGQGESSNCTVFLLIGAACLWFFASLGPTLGIFGSFGDHARADRFLYLPAMALPIAVVLLLGRDKRDPPLGEAASRRFTGTTGLLPVAGLAGLAVVVAGFFAIAYPVVTSYRTDLAAFTHTLTVDPDNWRALAHIGQARCATGEPLRRMGKPEGEGELRAGIDMLRHSYAVKANDATAVKLVYALMCRGQAEDWDEILAVCAKFDTERDPSGRALEALGTAELKKRRWREAIQHLWHSRNAAARNYARDDVELKLAFALHNGGRREEARKWFEWFRDHSGRADLVRRARDALFALDYSPRGMLFW